MKSSLFYARAIDLMLLCCSTNEDGCSVGSNLMTNNGHQLKLTQYVEEYIEKIVISYVNMLLKPIYKY